MKMTVFLILIILPLLLGWLAAAQPALAQTPESVYEVEADSWQVVLLPEVQRGSSVSILIEPPAELVTGRTAVPSAVNAFLLRNKAGEAILADVAFGARLFDQLSELGLDPGGISAVLLTHMHGDHIGGLIQDGRRAFPRAKLYLSRQEYNYWTHPAQKGPGFEKARETLALYQPDVALFDPAVPGSSGTDLLAGIRPVAAYGHTPGHTMYLVGSEADRVLLWGDLTHAMAVQMPAPQVAVTYDVDPQTAAASRLAVLNWAERENIVVGGMHVPWPGLGRLRAAEDGGYLFEPLSARP